MIRKTSFCRVFVLLLLLAPWLVIAAGCGPNRPEVAKVKGRVTFRGAPVASGTIFFWPETGRPARGKIASDGTFSLTTFDADDGAVLGTHCVTIEATIVHDSGPKPTSMEEEIAMANKGKPNPQAKSFVQQLVPQKYSNRATSGLSATVKREDNSFDFNL